MHLARIVLITIITPLALWNGVAHMVANGDSPTSTPRRIDQSAVAQLALEPAADSSTVVIHQAAVPVELTPAERELVEWATARFALVGLELPAVDVSFHDDTEPCNGNDGIYRRDGDLSYLRVCIADRGTFASNLERQRTLLHELAHAWEQANLDETQRLALLDTLGAEDWYAPDAEWGERGAERFAETLVWGLYDQIRRPTLIAVPCEDLHADFVTITGHEAPGPVASVCSPDAASD